MKKTAKTALVATAFIASMNLNGCAYGPEPYYDDENTPTDAIVTNDDTYDPENDDIQNEYAPATFYDDEPYHPEEDEIADVYGPPVDYN